MKGDLEEHGFGDRKCEWKALYSPVVHSHTHLVQQAFMEPSFCVASCEALELAWCTHRLAPALLELRAQEAVVLQ